MSPSRSLTAMLSVLAPVTTPRTRDGASAKAGAAASSATAAVSSSPDADLSASMRSTCSGTCDASVLMNTHLAGLCEIAPTAEPMVRSGMVVSVALKLNSSSSVIRRQMICDRRPPDLGGLGPEVKIQPEPGSRRVSHRLSHAASLRSRAAFHQTEGRADLAAELRVTAPRRWSKQTAMHAGTHMKRRNPRCSFGVGRHSDSFDLCGQVAEDGFACG